MSFSIVAFGRTGDGKSTLLNRILGDNYFAVGSGLDSQTTQLKFQECGRKSALDTPGTDDSDGNTKQYVQQIVQAINSNSIKAVAFVVNFLNSAFNPQMQNNIRFLCEMFQTAAMWKNVCIIFTRCYKDTVTQQEKEDKRKFYSSKITQAAQQVNGTQLGPISCYFVDSEDYSDANTQHELSCLEAWAQSLQPLSTYGQVGQPNVDNEQIQTETRHRQVGSEQYPIYGTRLIPNIVDVQVKNMVEVHIKKRILGIVVKNKTKMEQRGFRTEKQQQGTIEERYISGYGTTNLMVEERRENTVYADHRGTQYGEWQIVRDYIQ